MITQKLKTHENREFFKNTFTSIARQVIFRSNNFVILCLIMSVSAAVTLPPSKLTESDPEFWRQSADRLIEAFKDKQKASSQPIKRPKNVILFIGDGMSLATLTAARYLKAEQESKLHGQSSLVWDEWTGLSLVQTFNLNKGTTDSAAAATAMLCGAKVNQYTLGVNANVKCCKCRNEDELHHINSTLTQASMINMGVGLVTTTTVTYSTPAAAYAHSADRRWQGDEISLFSDDHMNYEVDRLAKKKKNEPSLAEMTEAAIRVLSRNPNGYLLLVEAGRIDHAHHENQARRALTDTLALEDAVKKALDLVDRSETLMIVTADHGHAYTMLGSSSRNSPILGLSDHRRPFKTEDKKEYLSSAYSSGPGAVVNQSRRNPADDDISDNTYKYQALVPMKHAAHSAEDVPLYAIGPLSELFHSTIDNTFIAYAQRYALCLEPYANEPHCKSATSTSDN